MAKIESITPEQEALIPKIKEEYIDLAEGRADRVTAEWAVNTIYKQLDKPEPRIIWAESPSEAKRVARELGIDSKPLITVWRLTWAGWYDCAGQWGVEFDKDKYELHQAWARNIQLGYYGDETAVISDKPRKIHWEGENLHNESGPCVEYHDGTSALYNLHGISMEPWMVMTPANEITVQQVMAVTNTDQQRELLRKIGPERLLIESDSKTLDSWVDPKTGFNYDLMEMELGELTGRYLYFEHASMPGVMYAKPVPPQIGRAIHARAWILSIIEVDEITKFSDEYIIERLPSQVS